jgi:hypothetical protein
MSGMLASTKVNEQRQSFPSDKIQFLISSLIGQYALLNNWQLQYVPKENMLICNVPATAEGANIQLVCNQITYSWATFSGMDATTWNTFGDHPFFGTYNGQICIAWEGDQDNIFLNGTGGKNIVAIAQQAYSYLESPGTQKQVGMYRPNFIVETPLSFNSTITYDFVRSTLGVPDAADPLRLVGYWDAFGSNWDKVNWGGNQGPQRAWVQAQGMGVAAAISLLTSSASQALWVSTDYSYQTGGLL